MRQMHCICTCPITYNDQYSIFSTVFLGALGNCNNLQLAFWVFLINNNKKKSLVKLERRALYLIYYLPSS